MLYHYTTIEKLKNILNTQQLWLTKISDFEDNEEFNHTIKLVSNELSVSFEDLLHEVTKVNNNMFVSCFCSDFDKPYLWKDYGKFNIGFSKKNLMSMVSYQQRAFGYITASSNFLRCEYCNERQTIFIKKAFKQCNEGNVFNIPVNPLSHLATIYKNSKFCPEQETRLVLYLKNDSPKETLTHGCKKRDYFVLPFRNELESQPIKSITIGPTSRPDVVERDLNTFLEVQRIENIAIKHSNISHKDFLEFQSTYQPKGCENCEGLYQNH